MMPRERRRAIARPALCSVIMAPRPSTSLHHSRQLTPRYPRRCSRRSSLPSGPIYFSVPAHLLALEAGSIHLTERRGTAAAHLDARHSMSNPIGAGTRCVSTILLPVAAAAVVLTAGV